MEDYEKLTLIELKQLKNKKYLEYYSTEPRENVYLVDLINLEIWIAIKEIQRNEERKSICNLLSCLKHLKQIQ